MTMLTDQSPISVTKLHLRTPQELDIQLTVNGVQVTRTLTDPGGGILTPEGRGWKKITTLASMFFTKDGAPLGGQTQYALTLGQLPDLAKNLIREALESR